MKREGMYNKNLFKPTEFQKKIITSYNKSSEFVYNIGRQTVF